MKQEIKVPAMGESISEATVGQILKSSGTQVKMDDEVLELETDKVNQVLYSPLAGVVKLSVSPGDVVKIGQVIGEVDGEGNPSEEKQAPEEKKEKELPKAEEKQVLPSKTAEARVTKDAFLETLSKPDVVAPKPQQPKNKQQLKETRQKMSRIRRVIANRLVEAQQNTAMLTTFNEVDLTTVMALRKAHQDNFMKTYGVKLGFMSFFVKAAISALQKYPLLNSYIDGEDIVERHYYDIGIAVGTERGLVVPVVRACDQKSFGELERSIVEYAEKARSGGLVVDDLQGGGFTITNGGVYGSLLSTPILNLPQCGILGMHKIQKRPVVVEDQIVIRPMMYLALSYDHRIIDGKEAVSFLVHLKEALEDPARLLIGL